MTSLWATTTAAAVALGIPQYRVTICALAGVRPLATRPVSQTVPKRGSATCTLVVSASSDPVSCSWTRDGMFLTDDGRINGSTTTTLTISNVTLADAGTYHALVANVIGVWSSLN